MTAGITNNVDRCDYNFVPFLLSITAACSKRCWNSKRSFTYGIEMGWIYKKKKIESYNSPLVANKGCHNHLQQLHIPTTEENLLPKMKPRTFLKVANGRCTCLTCWGRMEMAWFAVVNLATGSDDLSLGVDHSYKSLGQDWIKKFVTYKKCRLTITFSARKIVLTTANVTNNIQRIRMIMNPLALYSCFCFWVQPCASRLTKIHS